MMSDQARSENVVASVDELKVHFQSKRGIVRAVDGISFDIRIGETLGLVGETGCGKSVTGRSFLRLLPVPPGILAGGSVKFHPQFPCSSCQGAGCRVCDNSGQQSSREKTLELLKISTQEMRKIRGDRIAMIFQDPGKALNPILTIGAQLSEVFLQHRAGEILQHAGLSPESSGIFRRFASNERRIFDKWFLAMPRNRAKKRRLEEGIAKLVERALADTQVPNPAKLMARFPHELSGGMRQRVMIAQALACNPDILIADEPTTALDVTVEARILELIRELQTRRKTSILYISHDLSLVRQICNRVAIMYAGRIVEIGTTDDIFSNPRHPYTRGLMDAVPTAEASRGGLSAIGGTVPELVNPPRACRFAGRCPYKADSCQSHDPNIKAISPTHSVACFIDHAAPSGGRPSYEYEKP